MQHINFQFSTQWDEECDQIVEGGDDKAKAEESVSCQPGEEERAEGEEEAEKEQEGGCQGDLGGKLLSGKSGRETCTNHSSSTLCMKSCILFGSHCGTVDKDYV